MRVRRVAVVGLDGMVWHILNRLFEYDVMPALKRITQSSLRGVLEPTVPTITPPAWASMASGVNPGKHGVFGFTSLTKNYESRLLTSHYVRYPRLHDMVALKGLKSVCINQPLTYPITELKNSMVISDWLAPSVCCHPKSFERYKQLHEPYASERKGFDCGNYFLPSVYKNTRAPQINY